MKISSTTRKPSEALGVMTPIARLWALRLIVPLGAHRELLSDDGFHNEMLGRAVGLPVGEELEPDDPPTTKQHLMALRVLHRAAERAKQRPTLPPQLRRNVQRLSDLLHLSDLEQRLLAFAVLLFSDAMLEAAADGLRYISTSVAYRMLATLLDAQPKEVREALSSRGTLVAAGLLQFDRAGQAQLSSKLSVLSGEFADQMVHADSDPIDLLKASLVPSRPAELAAADYPHVEPMLAVLVPYLEEVLRTARPGANVLLHGVPGTGKTQLARLLAANVAAALFEVSSEDSDGDSISGLRRLQAYRAAQCFLKGRRAIILFDEVEDVFVDAEQSLNRFSKARVSKAWINRMLEENTVPAVWITNSIASIDAAAIRRFDVVLELRVPPRPQREKMLIQYCGDLAPPDSIRRLADAEALAPAVAARAAAVIRSVREKIDAEAQSSAVELLINQTLQAQGHKALARRRVGVVADLYDRAFINADVDVDLLTSGLIAARSGRLCLYGPPGTGKSAFAHWLAVQMRMPLVAKRASDLMSPWLGETEKNVARAFREAQDQGALLLIDEIDAFLRDRAHAKQSWEHSLTAEMLTQMECFDGLLIATTNLASGLDPAALRRFDLKARFDHLKPPQAKELLDRHCRQLGLGEPPQWVLNKVARLAGLAPGDFAAVARQHRFHPLQTPQDFVFALERDRLPAAELKVPVGLIN